RERNARAQERGAPDRAGGPADAAGEHQRRLLEETAEVLVAELVPAFEQLREAARQRVAEVAVADDGVELAEVRLVVDRRPGDDADDLLAVAQRGSVAHPTSSGIGADRQASRSRRVTSSPGRAGLRFASTPLGSPR